MTAAGLRISRHMLARAALLGMLLRIAVPAGFMPADVAGGWFLQLCPDGIPASVAAVLLGHSHHAHDHDQAPDSQYVQCELGGGLSGAALLERPADLAALVTVERFDLPAATVTSPLIALRAYDSRAPPRLLVPG